MGKLIVLNHRGHTEYETDLKVHAMQLIREGYEFWTFTQGQTGMELYTRVRPDQIVDDMNLIGLRPIAGG